jgi:serine/threonine-protein kinase
VSEEKNPNPRRRDDSSYRRLITEAKAQIRARGLTLKPLDWLAIAREERAHWWRKRLGEALRELARLGKAEQVQAEAAVEVTLDAARGVGKVSFDPARGCVGAADVRFQQGAKGEGSDESVGLLQAPTIPGAKVVVDAAVQNVTVTFENVPAAPLLVLVPQDDTIPSQVGRAKPVEGVPTARFEGVPAGCFLLAVFSTPTVRPSLPDVPGFEVERRLGSGGMGDVYLARDLCLNRQVALKTLREDWVDEGALARFRAEAEALARLNNPNVVQVYDVREREHDGHPFLVLEYVSGGDLERRLNGAPLPPRAAAQLVETLARTLQVVHDSGMVHRDLKPANVLLAGDPGAPLDRLTPKVSDFGLVKFLGTGQGRTRSGEVLGTPSYMAPEQASGRAAEADAAADVYALGAILYECLTGRPPFRGETTLDTLWQVCKLPPVSPRKLNPKAVDASLEYICLKCLEKSPQRRYRSAAELAEHLRRWLDGNGPVQTWPEYLGQLLRARTTMARPDVWRRVAQGVACWSLIAHTAFALLLLSGPGALACWAWFATLHGVGWLLIWLRLGTGRQLEPNERGLLLNWGASVVAETLLFALFCPPLGQATPAEVLRVYPAWLTIHGLMWIMQAREYSGRFSFVGLAFFAAAPLLLLCGPFAPTVFGLINACCLLWLAAGLRQMAREQVARAPMA